MQALLAASAVRAVDRAGLAPGDLMALFWLVREIDGARVVRIQPADALVFARMRAYIDAFDGQFVEAHVLDAKTALGQMMLTCPIVGDVGVAAFSLPPVQFA